MNATALARREPLHAILTATLARGWTEQFGRPHHVSSALLPGGQEWRLHATLSVCTRPSIDRAARRFVADGYRYTRSRSRLVQRWVRGTAAASQLAQTRARPEARFWVVPPLPGADAMVIVPGNQRVRLFDTQRGRVRAVLKDGFDPAPMLTEIGVRRRGTAGPYLPVIGHDLEGGWFEEPLIAGYSLDACPPWRPYRDHLRVAADLLGTWLDDTAEERDLGEHLGGIAEELRLRAIAVDRAYGVQLADRVARVLERLHGAVRHVGRLSFALTHGDLQPANVLVPRGGGAPVLVDWEHAGWRFREYDGLVHGLLSRVGPGRRERVTRYVDDGTLSVDLGLLPRSWGRADRRMAAALCAIEDLARQLREASQGRYLAVPAALSGLLADIEVLAEWPLAARGDRWSQG